MISNWIALLTIFTLAIFIAQYHWKRRHIYQLAKRLPGPPALPIIGNALVFLCNRNDILRKITEATGPYPTPLRFWFGPTLIVYFSKPRHVEKLLSSSKLAYKHEIYDLIKIYLGDGLVSNSGPKYKVHRKLIQPLFNLKFVIENMENFQKHINILLNRLGDHANGKENVDIHKFLHVCFADIIGETVLGMPMGAQVGNNSKYLKATTDLYEIVHSRIMRPWLHPDIIYTFTKEKKKQEFVTDVTRKFIQENVNKAIIRAKQRTFEEKEDTFKNANNSIIDQIADIIDKNPGSINYTDFIYHMLTLYLASEDTMTIISAIVCMCLGMYPEYQKIAAEEIRSVFGETPREVTYDDLRKLIYLDMCIRDVLRLIPIAPIILRQTSEDFLIDNITIPKGCGVMISIFDVHRNPEYWENPEHFHPNHFLPESVKKRHPFAYVPFSGGPRSCVGKVLATNGLKLMIANILQNFEIEADGKFPDVVLTSDITVRSASGYDVRLKRRVWT